MEDDPPIIPMGGEPIIPVEQDPLHKFPDELYANGANPSRAPFPAAPLNPPPHVIPRFNFDEYDIPPPVSPANPDRPKAYTDYQVPEDDYDQFPTLVDVASTRAALLTKLPGELVDSIIDIVEYWPYLAVSLAEPCLVSTIESHDYDGHLLLFQTPPIPGRSTADLDDPRRHKPVRKIVFKFESRDQGLVKERALEYDGFVRERTTGGPDEFIEKECDPEGFVRHPNVKKIAPYYASFSWFEAYIERPRADIDHPLTRLNVLHKAERRPLKKPQDISVDIQSRMQPRASSTYGYSRTPLGQRYRGIGWDILPVNGKRNWPVQRNVHSGKNLKQHTVVWKHDDKDVWGSEQEKNYAWERTSGIDGRGLGGAFVRALRTGDRVILVARAQKWRWVNEVENASMVVYYYA
ncbi:hypothetical protein RUND412_005223 [Rhizina undulata]